MLASNSLNLKIQVLLFRLKIETEYKIPSNCQNLIFSNVENIYTNETIVYDLLENKKKDLNENYDVCIYLLASQSTNSKIECSKCSFLNGDSQGFCEICFGKLSIKNENSSESFLLTNWPVTFFRTKLDDWILYQAEVYQAHTIWTFSAEAKSDALGKCLSSMTH